MGHRRKSAPRRGSTAFRPRARASHLIPKVRFWPALQEPKLLGFAGYKVGMTYGYIMEDNKVSPNYGKEIFTPLTIIETPPIWVCALRAYQPTVNGLKTYSEAWTKKLPKDINRTLKPPSEPKTEEELKKIEENLDKLAEIRVIACTIPTEAGLPKKKPDVSEIPVGGKTIKEKFEYAKNILGKRVQPSDIFSEGKYVDVISISKGKGIAGPVKRFGVRILQNKSRKTVRGVGCIGPWNPHLVMSTVARAGQLGFFQRVEFNKRIVKIGSDPKEINFKGGFNRYGIVRSPYIILKGTVAGPPKRLVKLRYAVRSPEKTETPKITLINIS